MPILDQLKSHHSFAAFGLRLRGRVIKAVNFRKTNSKEILRMESLGEFLGSGLVEAYAMGLASAEECLLVEEMMTVYPEVKKSLDDFNDLLEAQAIANAKAPDPLIRPFFLATINFSNRMMAGEAPSFPPELQPGSSPADYETWLQRPDMGLPPDFEAIHARIIGYTPQMTTAIVYIKSMAPQEVHDHEYEKFLVLEGTCDIDIEGEIHALVPGDFLAIPLYKKHFVKVTSTQPCKVILQRVAA